MSKIYICLQVTLAEQSKNVQILGTYFHFTTFTTRNFNAFSELDQHKLVHHFEVRRKLGYFLFVCIRPFYSHTPN